MQPARPTILVLLIVLMSGCNDAPEEQLGRAAVPVQESAQPELFSPEPDEDRELAQNRLELSIEQTNNILRHAPSRGPANAPVTIIEFVDFQCPFCTRSAATMETLLVRYPDTVRVLYVAFPLTMHQWARQAAFASACAAQQDERAFWILHDQYFENQTSLNIDNLMSMSRSYLSGSDLDLDQWEVCVLNEQDETHTLVADQVERGMAYGRQQGVRGTPSFLVNGHFVSGAQPVETFEALLADQR